MEQQAFSIVICYHEADEASLRLLESHLASLSRERLAEIWHRGKVPPGEDPRQVLDVKLRQASLVLLLISADFVASHGATVAGAVGASGGDQRVVPVLLRPCIWSGLPYFGLRPVPASGEYLLVEGQPAESRFHAAASEVRDLLVHLRSRPRTRADAPTAMQRTVIETLAHLERERHDLERHTLHTLTPPTLPDPLPEPVFASPSDGARTLPTFPDSTALSVHPWLGPTGTLPPPPPAGEARSETPALGPALRRLRASLIAVLGQSARELSDGAAIGAAASFIERHIQATPAGSRTTTGAERAAEHLPPSRTLFSSIQVENCDSSGRRG